MAFTYYLFFWPNFCYFSVSFLHGDVPFVDFHSFRQWSTSATRMQLDCLGLEAIHELLKALRRLLTHLHRRYL
jgi:hypothetical protein